jgi:shikimate dehydrogenase
VVATTPPGSTDELAGAVPSSPGVLLDVVYDPWPTTLAAAWSRSGGTVASGLDLLVHQAVGQVRLMTGRDVPVAVLRAALEAR